MGGGLMFALGISWCASTEFVILRRPEVLPYVYVAQIIPLLIYRAITYFRYVRSFPEPGDVPEERITTGQACIPPPSHISMGTRRAHWSHYTLELCYFSNALLIVSSPYPTHLMVYTTKEFSFLLNPHV
jgi:hypothetical protein